VLNFNRNDRMPEPAKDPSKPTPRPNPLATSAPIPASPAPMGATPARTPVPAASEAAAAAPGSEPKGSKLSIGPNINLKGVEISNCDVIVIEGNVDATINSKIMEIGQPVRLNATAIIDVAEIHGVFSAELTARTKLVVHATGRVTGTARYGKLVVAEGGTLTGELKQLDVAADREASSTAPSASSARPLLNPQPH
jgi:cytoskeletal protein CcmA (bactofilin family)